MEKQEQKYQIGAEVEFNVPRYRSVITFRFSFEMAALLVFATVTMIIGLAHANKYPSQQEYNATAVANDTIALQQSTVMALSEPTSNVPAPTSKKDAKVRADLPAKPAAAKPIKITFSTDEEKQDSAYIHRFQKVAIAEMEKYGIPASISMAQGILESDAGQSRLATKANNHFGVKCHSRSCKPGHCMNSTDDTHKDFFIVYSNAWGSWRAHSQLLVNPDRRYHQFVKSCGNDYECWAYGLKKKGYATNPQYAEILIDLIKKYQLYRLDSKQLLLN